ncbi:MAG: class I SAM-dependent methyltransferase [Bacteroidales bacterium]|nr:class I SAM-dependent methyltransferase [Bacteroidales bacterium]MCF6342651.1 class I SAM-dependent methyltransferase [Bacteroidales bacterium]
MEVKHKFIKKYEEGIMPWAHKKPDFNLVQMVHSRPIGICKTFEPGCGTGTDAIWLAAQGFSVLATDASEIAIDLAREQAKKQNSNCRFEVSDFMHDKIEGGPFGFVFDRGFFHTFDKLSDRKEFARRVSNVLLSDGLWLSLIGSADDFPRKKGEGPPQHPLRNVVKVTEPYFEILSIKASRFGSEAAEPAKNWVCLMKKR